MIKRFIPLAACLAVASLLASTATAAEVTLKAVSAFAGGTTFTKNFERFIAQVNKTGKGVIQINYLGGGGKVMSPFELGKNVQKGIVHIGNLPGAFYTNLMPEADAIKLSQFTIAEERKNGAWAAMNKIHMAKVNAYHLARQKDCVPFHLYINKKIAKPDLNGFKIRVTPIYRAFFASMGASMIRTKPGDVYTALQRGVVDGYGWPTQGVLDLGWHKVTKYRVDPGFYRASVEVLVNLDMWKKLTAKQKAVLQNAGAWMEKLCAEDLKINASEIKRQAGAGIQTIAFTGKAGADYLKRAYETGWAAFIKVNPKSGPMLKKLLSK